jgi:hypothetical protein
MPPSAEAGFLKKRGEPARVKEEKMVRYFSDNATRPNRARQAFEILIGCAMRKQLISYGELKGLMYPETEGGGAQSIAPTIGCILFWCQANNLPLLNTIVINESSPDVWQRGLPGSGCGIDPEEVPAMWARVFEFDWYSIEPPTEEELAETACGLAA